MKLLKTRALISRLREKELKHEYGMPITDSEYRNAAKEIKSFEKSNKILKLAVIIAVAVIVVLLFK